MKEKFRLYYGDMIPEDSEERAGMDPARLEELTKIKDRTWLVYLEWMDGFFIELFDEISAHIENIPDDTKYGYTHFAFVVDDIHDFYRMMQDKGAESYIDITPHQGPDGGWYMWFHDPDFNKVEVHQYCATSMQVIGRKKRIEGIQESEGQALSGQRNS